MNITRKVVGMSVMAVLVSVVFCGFLSRHAFADRGGKQGAFDIVAGLPQLIGAQGSYIGVKNFSFGLGYGFLPINKVLGDKIKIKNFSLGNNFELRPNMTYTFTTPVLFVRWYPSNEGFYLNALYSRWKINANVSADLVRTVSPTLDLKNALNGDISITQPNVGLTAGYTAFLSDVIYFDFGLGATYLLGESVDVNLGGDPTTIVTLAALSAAVTKAKEDFEGEVKKGVSDAKKDFKYLPLIYISFGFVF